jgi:hypothetical protein
MRSTEDTFHSHLNCREQGDVEGDLQRNYAQDVIVLSGTGIHRGHDGVRETSNILEQYLPNAQFHYRTKLVEDEYAFLEWTAENESHYVEDGADGFVIRNGKIVCQTIHYTVREKQV